MESARRAVKDRIIKDMIGSISDSTGGGWKVLVLDDLTTRVLSATVKLSDIQECSVSVVEDLNKIREPLPLPALYFIQPTAASVTRLVADFEDDKQLYPSVHIFFSSKASTEAVERIKACPQLIAVLKTLKESNLEFLTLDSRSLITDHPKAAVKLMGERCEAERREADKEMDSIVTRMTTVFATLNDFPSVRYKVGKPVSPSDPPGATARSSLTARMATKLHERLAAMQRAGGLPNKETCDLLVLDRSYDAVAPVIHEWTYECMVYDLLKMKGNVFKFQPEHQKEEKEMLLEEHDDLWVELRHGFIADVYTTINTKFKEFQSKNKAAKHQTGHKDKMSEMTTGNIRSLIQALPQFREFLGRLSLHIQISSEIKTASNERQLTTLGEMEQDLVFGEKNQKDLLAFLQENAAELKDEDDKMRLFMCYLATHPGKMDGTRRVQWQKVAQLSPESMATVCNLAYLGVNLGSTPVVVESKSGFFGRNKPPKEAAATRKKREEQDEEQYRLAHFNPLLLDVLEEVQAGKLSTEEYPFVKPPQQQSEEAPESRSTAASARTRSGLTWARRNPTQEAALASARIGGAGGGRRLVVFIIGGMTRGEMRIVHQMAQSSGRDIVIASTSVETPATFIATLKSMGSTPGDAAS